MDTKYRIDRIYIRDDGTGLLCRRGYFDQELSSSEVSVARAMVARVGVSPLAWTKKAEFDVSKGMGSEKTWERLRRKLGGTIESRSTRRGGVRLTRRIVFEDYPVGGVDPEFIDLEERWAGYLLPPRRIRRSLV